MTTRQEVVAALFIDCGEGREIKHGARAGQIRWTQMPSARFECLLCQTAETPIVRPGEPIPAAVTRFIAHIRTTHQAVCTAAWSSQGAAA
ncbi:hypothetical protein L1085_016150 [Streptomyces sp. MSC1_001]|jgi:hypothetical protein|uniref:hypothetical protein n=1 Tax=Streptomyces sp. MSC1_001 TaxID=2909263 RepID=UPI00203058C4|nr:hypothetical protein [Streptomyces sp. MSC1_001]